MPKPSLVVVLPIAIKTWRRERGMTQLALAEATGMKCSAGLIALIETGRRQPGLVNAIAIAQALEIPLAAIATVYATTKEIADAASKFTQPVGETA